MFVIIWGTVWSSMVQSVVDIFCVVRLSLQACTTNLQLKKPLRERLDGVLHVYFWRGLSPDSCSCSILFKFLGAHFQWKKWSPKPSTMICMCAACRYTCFYRICVDRMSSRSLDDADGRIVRIVYSPCIDVFTMMKPCLDGNRGEQPASQSGSPLATMPWALRCLNNLVMLERLIYSKAVVGC